MPRDENLREVRKRGATVIETHRIDNGIAHEDHAFGPTLRYNSDLVIPPAVPRQVILQIETTQRTLYPDPPDPGPDLGLGL